MVLLIRRSKVHNIITKEWPGNEILILRGPIQKRTQTGLISLSKTCCQIVSFIYVAWLPIVFGPKAIWQHALDCLNELRRRVHNGHDFDEVLLQTI